MEFFKLALVFSLIQFLRYFLIAGFFYVVFWKFPNKLTQQRAIQTTPFQKNDLIREFGYSTISSFIFGVILTLAFQKQQNEIYRIDLTLFKTTFWVLLLILIHDTYFYWMHRLIHHKNIFPYVHKIHHLSRNPSPFAALSFHPYEAVLEIIWIWPLAHFVYIDMGSWVVFGFVIILINVLGHLNVEIYPESWKQNSVLKYLNFSKNHNDHHRYFNDNYGLYFSFWDRFMKTFRA